MDRQKDGWTRSQNWTAFLYLKFEQTTFFVFSAKKWSPTDCYASVERILKLLSLLRLKTLITLTTYRRWIMLCAGEAGVQPARRSSIRPPVCYSDPGSPLQIASVCWSPSAGDENKKHVYITDKPSTRVLINSLTCETGTLFIFRKKLNISHEVGQRKSFNHVNKNQNLCNI